MQLTDEQKQAFAQQKLSCPFCQMIEGKIPTHKVYEDDHILAILDIAPAANGHVLVMPKEHYPILPFVPEEEFTALFSRAREISEHLRKAMLAPHVTTVVATGGVAGQTAQHVAIHVIPSDTPLSNLKLPEKQHPEDQQAQIVPMLAQNLPIMMRNRSPLFAKKQTSADLATLIQEHPGLKEMLINNPDGVLLGLEENPSLKPLFEGVNVHELSKQLKALEEQTPPPETPMAAQLEPHELVAFIEEKESLKNYLLTDIESLEQALPQQPKLQTFFQGTSPAEVRDRYLAALERTPGGSK